MVSEVFANPNDSTILFCDAGSGLGACSQLLPEPRTASPRATVLSPRGSLTRGAPRCLPSQQHRATPACLLSPSPVRTRPLPSVRTRDSLTDLSHARSCSPWRTQPGESSPSSLHSLEETRDRRKPCRRSGARCRRHAVAVPAERSRSAPGWEPTRRLLGHRRQGTRGLQQPGIPGEVPGLNPLCSGSHGTDICGFEGRGQGSRQSQDHCTQQSTGL